MAKRESESTYICMDNTQISEKTFFVHLGFGGYILWLCWRVVKSRVFEWQECTVYIFKCCLFKKSQYNTCPSVFLSQYSMAPKLKGIGIMAMLSTQRDSIHKICNFKSIMEGILDNTCFAPHILLKAKEKYRGMFETHKSGNKTSSWEIGLDIRTHASLQRLIWRKAAKINMAICIMNVQFNSLGIDHSTNL